MTERMIGTEGGVCRFGGMKLSAAQSRAVELLAGEEGWVTRGTIAKGTMDVLLRLDMVEAKRNEVHSVVYRATQNARDWVHGQQEDSMPKGEAYPPIPTADDVATMTGDPVAWFDGLTTIQAPAPVPGYVIDFSGLLSEQEVSALPTPREAVAAMVATLPWSARGRKRKVGRGARRRRNGR